MSLPRPDFALLERLRARFLDAPSEGGDYWSSPDLLAAYDATFGERIGWKWDAVLAELRARGWAPPAGTAVLDWGCGSGVAGRRVLGAFGAPHFQPRAVAGHGDARRVISAILQALQPLDDDGHHALLAHVSDDTAHVSCQYPVASSQLPAALSG